jgi:ribosomal protein S19
MKQNLKNYYTKVGIVVLTSMVGFTLPSFAYTENFESYTGPSTFGGPAQTITDAGGATFTGGTILTAETFLPADETTVYATAGGLSNPITITDPSGFNNFFFDLYNGQTYADTYVIADNAGHSATFTLAPNVSSGNALVGFPSTGTQITITAEDPHWDFSIDNVTWDEPLPPSLAAPEVSSTAWLMAGTVLSLAVFARRSRVTA